MPKFIDTKTIIVNLLLENQREHLSLGRLQELLNYIYKELWRQNKLKDYQISFDVSFEALERTVIYNRDIFALDVDNEVVYLRHTGRTDISSRCSKLDATLTGIIHSFCARGVQQVQTTMSYGLGAAEANQAVKILMKD